MSALHRFLEVDLLGGLQALASEPGPRYLVGPAGREAAQQLRALLLDEGHAFHEVERDVAERRCRALEAVAASRPDEPGEAFALDAAAAARAEAERHRAALAQLEVQVDAVLTAFELRPRTELAALATGEGLVVELYDDGWSLEATRAARLAARREHLGLPAERDWLPRGGA